MPEFDGELKPWGNSHAIVVPKDVMKKARVKAHSKLHILIFPENNMLKKTFGMLKHAKWKHSTQELKDIMRKELYD